MAEFFGGFDPFLDDDFYVGESFLVSLSVGGAAGEFGDFGDKCFVGLIPIDDAGCLTRRPCLPAAGRQASGGFESSSGRGFSHDAVRANATGIQIRLRTSRISSSRKQLWVGHVFFRFGTSGLQVLKKEPG